MKTRNILLWWAVGMAMVFAVVVRGQLKISQYPNTNALGPNQLFLVTAGNTNMNVKRSDMPAALDVPTLAQMYSQGASCTNNDTVVSNGGASFTMTTSNTLHGDYVSKDTITSNGNVAFTMAASNTLFGQIGAAAGTNVAMISAGWVEAGGGHITNDWTVDGTTRANNFNIGTLTVTNPIHLATNLNAYRLTATNRLTVGPEGSGTTFSNNVGVMTIRDSAGQTVGVIDNDATLGTAFWIISTPTSNSMAAAITASTNHPALAIGGGHLTNKMTIDGNLEFTSSLMDGGAQSTNYTLIAGTNDVYIGGSNVNIVAIMGGVAGRATPMSIVITNGTGVSWGISFSAVTNAWHWPYSQGAPTVSTNATQLLINLRLDGSNVLAAWAAYAWP